MKVFNVSMDDDDDDEEDEDDFYDESESVSPIHNVNGFRANTLWVNEENELTSRHVERLRQRRNERKRKNKRKKLAKKRELVICLNGSMIDDLESHAIEQMIAE